MDEKDEERRANPRVKREEEEGGGEGDGDGEGEGDDAGGVLRITDGEVTATPRKDTVLFRANGTRILRDGIYVVEDEGKYRGFVVGQTLSQPGAVCVKYEDDAQRHQQCAVRAVLAEPERTLTLQLRQALAAIKENVDTRVRV